MKVINWELIEESRPGTMLEPGGYVCRIERVEDVPSREYLWVVYDVAEGEKAGCYAGVPVADDWKHRFTRSYKESAQGMFKAFLNRLEESNRGRFSVADWQARGCNEHELAGLEVGLVFGKELYTNDRGEDKERTVVSFVEAAQDIRNGDFRVPEPKDRRESVAQAPARAASAPADDDLPF